MNQPALSITVHTVLSVRIMVAYNSKQVPAFQVSSTFHACLQIDDVINFTD